MEKSRTCGNLTPGEQYSSQKIRIVHGPALALPHRNGMGNGNPDDCLNRPRLRERIDEPIRLAA